MLSHPFFPQPSGGARRLGYLICALTIGALVAGTVPPTSAQLAAPTASPASTPVANPDPAASPSPGPEGTPVLVITPGVPDASAQADYNAARTPQASIVLGSQTTGATNTALSRSLSAGRSQATTDPSATIQPKPAGGVFAQVLLAPTPAAPSAKTSQTSATAAGTTTPVVPLAVVTLNYGAAWAGNSCSFVR